MPRLRRIRASKQRPEQSSEALDQTAKQTHHVGQKPASARTRPRMTPICGSPASLGAALGGASSNLLDKLCRGGVVDIIDVGFWPIFNLADTAIIVGGLVAVLYM